MQGKDRENIIKKRGVGGWGSESTQKNEKKKAGDNVTAWLQLAIDAVKDSECENGQRLLVA